MDIATNELPVIELTERIDNKDLYILLMISRGAPSIHEMKDKIMVRSPATPFNRLTKLQRLGLITSGAFRSIRSRKITEMGLGVLLQCSMIDSDSYAVKVKELNDADIQFPD